MILRWAGVTCIVAAIFLHGALAVFEDMEIELGQYTDFGRLTPAQFGAVSISTIVFLLLWAVGVIPMDIDLGRRRRKRGATSVAEISTYLLDCPLQFVCDVDAWANRDHDYYLESLVASWFRNSNHTWQRPDSEVYGGRGTCKEMYPCPFDVQEVVGIRIPGSNALPGTEEESYSFF
ncbi:uncharacterized protein LOC125032727 isoform X1 [Penaeus chinensis]|uniref:uncharacterized protein LOC125032727 isoform X1 n=1 Tax=Penaeus chinensis TaxID=139456 RepID=UPI001FB85905|nr:uncharacterized protein LOC125032727 isoform X1 [Penaeus chinensis]XP_047479979.1 uncharacterized protein LOC125032727 isoform X1 [Penaeus chinensis]